MAGVGADLQTANNELVAIVEELKDRRADLDRGIQKEEEAKAQLTAEIQALTARLRAVDESLRQKYAVRADFDKTIQETAVSFANILDSSKILLATVKKDSLALHTRAVGSPTPGRDGAAAAA